MLRVSRETTPLICEGVVLFHVKQVESKRELYDGWEMFLEGIRDENGITLDYLRHY